MDHELATNDETKGWDAATDRESGFTPIAGRYPGSAVLDEAGLGVVLFDPGGEIAASNATAEELLGRRVDRTTLLRQVLERAHAGGPSEGEHDEQQLVEVEAAGGRRGVVGYRVVRSPRLGTIFTLRDITELERTRAERRALERLSQVGRACAMVAHEIGNPLAALKATLQSIEREAAAAGLGDTIAAVFREIDRLDNILGQLLGFVRHRMPRRVRTDLSVVIARAREATRDRLQHISFHAPRGPLPDVHCDPDQMEQVFLNLFLNAAEAMGHRGEIRVRAGASSTHLWIRVEDSGPGVPAGLREKVFESFFTTRTTGVGLGLPVCLRIMSDHHGSISIEDREGGKGASVRLSLPFGTVTGRRPREERK
ncbi:Flagellar sensor histidine kinase FleS [Minicystis rosea]|nr:Flagellar sensor histidine kinase FleS [Minicystis rosea]